MDLWSIQYSKQWIPSFFPDTFTNKHSLAVSMNWISCFLWSRCLGYLPFSVVQVLGLFLVFSSASAWIIFFVVQVLRLFPIFCGAGAFFVVQVLRFFPILCGTGAWVISCFLWCRCLGCFLFSVVQMHGLFLVFCGAGA